MINSAVVMLALYALVATSGETDLRKIRPNRLMSNYRRSTAPGRRVFARSKNGRSRFGVGIATPFGARASPHATSAARCADRCARAMKNAFSSPGAQKRRRSEAESTYLTRNSRMWTRVDSTAGSPAPRLPTADTSRPRSSRARRQASPPRITTGRPTRPATDAEILA